ncbi:hypothetical protein CHS0354_008088 [Potamilus streckersoni]|uniref:Uncharacterized protein n=1 Tax=Potamilus streckersoni TaxID=2493646 RepID=A0AAE0SZZ1_9BIVA|nr:hypothetical protein CHS0354_008088 [Potamilus streckersoni]
MESALYRNCAIGDNNEAYLIVNYVIDLIQSNGGLVGRDIRDKNLATAQALHPVGTEPIVIPIESQTQLLAYPSKLPPSPSFGGISRTRRALAAKYQLIVDEEEHFDFRDDFSKKHRTPRTSSSFQSYKSYRNNQKQLITSTFSEDSNNNIRLSRLKKNISLAASRHVQYTKPINVDMESRVLYNQFDLKACPALALFKQSVLDTGSMSIVNVNRIFYYLCPTREKLDSVCNSHKTFSYICQLRMTSSSKLFFYIKKKKRRFSNSVKLKKSIRFLIAILTDIRDTLASVKYEIGKASKKRKAEESTSSTVAGELAETPSKEKEIT